MTLLSLDCPDWLLLISKILMKLLVQHVLAVARRQMPVGRLQTRIAARARGRARARARAGPEALVHISAREQRARRYEMRKAVRQAWRFISEAYCSSRFGRSESHSRVNVC